MAESDGYRILPGVPELLSNLIDHGYLLEIVTGNLEAAAHIKLHRVQLSRFFSFGGYGSDSTDRELTRLALKRAALEYGEPVTPDQAIVFGDTPHDVQGAHAAGMKCVGVGSHHFNIDQLRDSGAGQSPRAKKDSQDDRRDRPRLQRSPEQPKAVIVTFFPFV